MWADGSGEVTLGDLKGSADWGPGIVDPDPLSRPAPPIVTTTTSVDRTAPTPPTTKGAASVPSPAPTTGGATSRPGGTTSVVDGATTPAATAREPASVGLGKADGPEKGAATGSATEALLGTPKEAASAQVAPPARWPAILMSLALLMVTTAALGRRLAGRASRFARHGDSSNP